MGFSGQPSLCQPQCKTVVQAVKIVKMVAMVKMDKVDQVQLFDKPLCPLRLLRRCARARS